MSVLGIEYHRWKYRNGWWPCYRTKETLPATPQHSHQRPSFSQALLTKQRTLNTSNPDRDPVWLLRCCWPRAKLISPVSSSSVLKCHLAVSLHTGELWSRLITLANVWSKITLKWHGLQEVTSLSTQEAWFRTLGQLPFKISVILPVQEAWNREKINLFLARRPDSFTSSAPLMLMQPKCGWWAHYSLDWLRCGQEEGNTTLFSIDNSPEAQPSQNFKQLKC